MSINAYAIIGVVLLFLSIVFLLLLMIYNFNMITKKRCRPLYQRELPKITFPDTFRIEIQDAYKKTGNMRNMLRILKTKYPKGAVHKRILAAESYLLHSRYQDFETMLFKYLSDGKRDLEKVYTGIIQQEVMKRRRLPCNM